MVRETDTRWIAQGLVCQTIGILPPNLTKSRSSEIWVQSYPIAMKFYSHLISSMLLKTQSDTTLLKTISRFFRNLARSYEKKQVWPYILCKSDTGQRGLVKIVMYNRWRLSVVIRQQFMHWLLTSNAVLVLAYGLKKTLIGVPCGSRSTYSLNKKVEITQTPFPEQSFRTINSIQLNNSFKAVYKIAKDD